MAAPNIHFLDPNSPVAAVLNSILEVAGENFTAPYDSGAQPHDVISANNETLIQYQMPGGSEMQGHADPGQGGSIGTAINSMLGLLSPAISAFALILPILGVIRGIIEILCCLMNPFCVIPAVIRLFTKWIPPFISLFPPAAGVVILISTIKAILAIIFYIMTEIVPVIQLIIQNIIDLSDAFAHPEDLTQAKRDATEAKLRNLVKTLIQKTGVMAVFLPLLELIFLILRLVSGFPCGDGNSDDENASTGAINISPISFPLAQDSSCCQDLCPEILSSRDAAPRGAGLLIQSSFGECAPLFAFKLFTGNIRVADLEPFQDSREEQLNCQLDEPIKYARPIGATGNRALIKVKISSRRGNSRSVVVPVIDLNGTVATIVSPLAILFRNQLVDYEFKPDYEMLVLEGVMGVGCHPDVRDAQRRISGLFDMTPVLTANPEAATLDDDYKNVLGQFDRILDDISTVVDTVDEPPFDQVAQLEGLRDEMLGLFNGFIVDLTDMMNAILSRNTSRSDFIIDKKIAIADGTDVVNITVIPRDVTGALIVKNIPANTGVEVEIISDFGEVKNQVFDNPTGTIVAELSSTVTGLANIRVKVNNKFVTTLNDVGEEIKIERVKFTSEAAIPIRRRKTKPSSKSAISTGTTSDKQPGNS